MKKMRQRWIAILCCVAMLVTGLYVSEPQKAEAASSGTLSITSTEAWFKLYDGGDTGYININFSISASPALEVRYYNAFTDDFIDKYMTFGGGMTKDDFKHGFDVAKYATSSIMQIRWTGREEAFTPGWSFTIAEGAEVPYNDGAAYVTLDKEYTFEFEEGQAGWTNRVDIAGYRTTTFSLPTDENDPIANGKSGGEYNLWFTFNTPNIPFAGGSAMLTSDETYADYIFVEGFSFSDLEANDIRFKVYFGASGQKSAFQILSWGAIRTEILKGDQIIFKQGMPLYFTDANGVQWKGVLDATYVYECVADYTMRDDHDQVFAAGKADSTNVFGLNTGTEAVSVNGEVNYGFAWTVGDAQETGYIEKDILTTYVAEEYLEFYGCTLQELTAQNSIKIMFIPTADVIQIELYDTSALDVGDQIILKKGMPIAWYKGSGYKELCAELDADYAFTVKSKTDSSVVIAVTQMGNLSITSMGFDTEYHGDVLYRYDQAFCTYEDAAEAVERLEQSVLKDYVYLSKHSYDDLINADAYLQYYTGHNMFRLYYQNAKMSLEEGEILIWKKGFPITYTTTSGKAKTVTLDKDYGFRYSTTQGFTYDPTLIYQEEPQQETFKFTSTSPGLAYEANSYRTNLVYATNLGTPTNGDRVANILTSTGAAGNTSDYVDVFGMTSEEVSQLGISIIMYPTAGTGTFQIEWGANVFDWIEDGLILTFKKGMPVYYATGEVMYLTEDAYYQVTNVTQPTSGEATDGAFTLQSYELPLEVKKFTLLNIFGTGLNFTEISENAETGIELRDAEGNKGFLNDADANEIYQWIGGGEVSYEEAARWVDYLGFSADQLETHGVKFRLVRNGDTQVINITWGTSVDRIALGSRITFKAGMPFTYIVGGKEQKIELAQDYIFEVTGTNDTNTWVFEALTTENSGTFSLEYGITENVASQNQPAEYYHNHTLADSDMLSDCVGQTQYVTIPTGVLMEYLEFGDIAPENYAALGISAKMILDAENVVQVIWGAPSVHTIDDGNGKQVATSDLVKEGDKIVFKIGMPITMTTKEGKTQRYVLDKNYSFTIEEYTLGANGYRVSGEVEEVKNIVSGDVDGDYLLNKNDITLIRKQLVNLIAVSDVAYVDANGKDEVTSADLVHGKKNWDTAEPETYTTLYEDVVIPSGNLAGGATTTITINKDLGTAGYLRFTYQSTANLYGTIYYTYNEIEYSENFYLSKDDVQFEQFLDNYRVNGVLGTSTPVSKTLTKITFKNLGDEAATFLLNKLEVSDREFKNDNMIYTDNGKVKIGVDLNQGGTLTWLQDLVHNPIEYTSNRTLKITPQDKYSSGSNAITDVNLVNIYDLGRQMQQSYYIDVLDTIDGHGTPYIRGSYNDNTNWPYNPVQAGDQYEHQSQIIDYRVIDGKMIYVKVRAMDWADPDNVAGNSASAEPKSQKGTTTKSYMESWYRLEDDMLYVDNAFTDWSGWTQVGEPYNQELPAFYTAAALNYFVSEKDTVAKTYGNWGVDGNFYRKEGSEVSDWYAWVNGNDNKAYGLGIYIPNATGCTAGRYRYTSKYSSWLFSDSSTSMSATDTASSNKGAGKASIFDVSAGNGGTIGDYLNAKTDYQNCYLANTSYIAPTIAAILKEYRTYSYTYVLHANELNEMKSSFAELEAAGTVTNQQLSIW